MRAHHPTELIRKNKARTPGSRARDGQQDLWCFTFSRHRSGVSVLAAAARLSFTHAFRRQTTSGIQDVLNTNRDFLHDLWREKCHCPLRELHLDCWSCEIHNPPCVPETRAMAHPQSAPRRCLPRPAAWDRRQSAPHSERDSRIDIFLNSCTMPGLHRCDDAIGNLGKGGRFDELHWCVMQSDRSQFCLRRPVSSFDLFDQWNNVNFQPELIFLISP